MTRIHLKNSTCSICHEQKSLSELVPADLVREPIANYILQDHPEWTADSSICYGCLNRYRADYMRKLLEEDKGELSALEEDVIRSLREQDSISEDVNTEFEEQLTLGERLADTLASFGGSWTFILLFGLVMVGWISFNTYQLSAQPFDPYPFILLNLVLSCLAAIQAPVIMMSQNRQEAKDRLRSQHDYRVNLKAELEIRLLHAKLDQLASHQWQRLLEIQQLQMELMGEALEQRLGRIPDKSRRTNEKDSL